MRPRPAGPNPVNDGAGLRRQKARQALIRINLHPPRNTIGQPRRRPPRRPGRRKTADCDQGNGELKPAKPFPPRTWTGGSLEVSDYPTSLSFAVLVKGF